MAAVSVRVREGWVVYDGREQRTEGAVVKVPAEVAAEWEQAGWVERVKSKQQQGSSNE